MVLEERRPCLRLCVQDEDARLDPFCWLLGLRGDGDDILSAYSTYKFQTQPLPESADRHLI